MRASLTLICQGETAASRGSHFPCDDPLEAREWQDAEAFQAWLEGAAPPGGESRAQLLARCGSWLAKHVDIRGRHCAIAPAAAIRATIVDVLGAPLHSFARIDIHPLSITELRSDGRRWNLCLLKGHINSE